MTDPALMRLIGNVCKNRCIWDRRDSFYNSPVHVEKAWDNVARSVKDCGVEEAKYEWAALRRKYLKCRQLKRETGKFASKTFFFPYRKMMTFLDPILRTRKTPNKANGKNQKNYVKKKAERYSTDSSDYSRTSDEMSEKEQKNYKHEESESYSSYSDSPEHIQSYTKETSTASTSRDSQQVLKRPRSNTPPSQVYLHQSHESQELTSHETPTGSTSHSQVHVVKTETKSREESPEISPLDEDPDKCFLLSLLPSLKKFPENEKSTRKLRIMEQLID